MMEWDAFLFPSPTLSLSISHGYWTIHASFNPSPPSLSSTSPNAQRQSINESITDRPRCSEAFWCFPGVSSTEQKGSYKILLPCIQFRTTRHCSVCALVLNHLFIFLSTSSSSSSSQQASGETALSYERGIINRETSPSNQVCML